jgi:hypothetical protein
MSGNELEELLDENQRMRNQRKWGLVALGLIAGAVAWGIYGHTAKASVEAALPSAKQRAALLARVARTPSPVVPQENLEAQQQEVAAQDEPPPAPPSDTAVPVVAAPATDAPGPVSPSTPPLALSFNVNGRGLNSMWGAPDHRYRGFADSPGYRGYRGYDGSREYRGEASQPGAIRGGARPAQSRGAVRSPGARPSAAARSFGGGGRR